MFSLLLSWTNCQTQSQDASDRRRYDPYYRVVILMATRFFHHVMLLTVWQYCYASAFRRRRYYFFGSSVRLSVRNLEYPLSTCTWVRWSIRPTVNVLRNVRPSVRLSVRPSGEVSGHLPENAWREWSEILHADVSWPPSELIRLWSRSVDFPPFGATLT